MISGKIEFRIYAIIAIALIATVTDLAKGKIFNALTLPGLVAGVLVASWFGGWRAGGDALLGAVAGLVLYGWMFWLRAMGGGDVKLLMAFGAWGGLHYAEEVAILGVLTGGALSLLVLLFTGRIVDFVKRMHYFFLTLFVKELEVEPPKIDRKHAIPFGLPLSVAAVWVVLLDPFAKWGIHLWP